LRTRNNVGRPSKESKAGIKEEPWSVDWTRGVKDPKVELGYIRRTGVSIRKMNLNVLSKPCYKNGRRYTQRRERKPVI